MKVNGIPIKAVIFDIDGVLIDSMPIWDDLGVRYLRAIGVEPEEDLPAVLFDMTIDEGVSYMIQHYHLDESETELHDGLIRELARFYRKEVPLKSGAYELVKGFYEAGVPMILATRGDRELEDAALQRLGVRGYLGEMLQCDELGTTKSESLIYDRCAEHLGFAPEEVLVVEDVLQAVETATRAHYVTMAVYDAASRSDFAAMRQTADIAVRSLRDVVLTA